MHVPWSWNKVFFVAAALAAASAGGFLAVRSTTPAIGDERVGQETGILSRIDTDRTRKNSSLVTRSHGPRGNE